MSEWHQKTAVVAVAAPVLSFAKESLCADSPGLWPGTDSAGDSLAALLENQSEAQRHEVALFESSLDPIRCFAVETNPNRGAAGELAEAAVPGRIVMLVKYDTGGREVLLVVQGLNLDIF
jgi:hypothetical protein